MSTASGIKLMTFIVLIIAGYNYIQRELHHDSRQNNYKWHYQQALALTMISIGITWIAIFFY